MANVELGPDRRFGWGRNFGPNGVPTGWRSYLLQRKAALDASHVAGAEAKDKDGNWVVELELTDDGAQRFQALTTKHLKRRIAIVLGAVVLSAPVVQEPITGGRVLITFGGSPAEQKPDAERLARKLNPS